MTQTIEVGRVRGGRGEIAMACSQRTVRSALLEQGFRPVYETAAVTLLTHPERPGYLIRLGVTRIVVERDGDEVYRSALPDFALDRLLALLAIPE